jgi:NTP pyrophosphatase (non-canonical NTP hydrolase)
MYYLGQPYSHENPDVREHRFQVALKVLNYFLSINKPCFSPIVQTHLLEPQPSSYWLPTDLAVLSRCDKLLVLKIDGWDKSFGLSQEIAEAKKMGMPIQEVFWDEEGKRVILGDYLFQPENKNNFCYYSSMNNYQRDASDLACYSTSIPIAVYPLMALSGEVGEVLNKFKKILRLCPETTDLQKVSFYIKEKVYENRDYFLDELGDILWYVSEVASSFGLSLEDIAENNILKLRKRYAKKLCLQKPPDQDKENLTDFCKLPDLKNESIDVCNSVPAKELSVYHKIGLIFRVILEKIVCAASHFVQRAWFYVKKILEKIFSKIRS